MHIRFYALETSAKPEVTGINYKSDSEDNFATFHPTGVEYVTKERMVTKSFAEATHMSYCFGSGHERQYLPVPQEMRDWLVANEVKQSEAFWVMKDAVDAGQDVPSVIRELVSRYDSLN